MTKVVFYSYDSAQNYTLLALALSKPKDVSIDWFVQYPVAPFHRNIDALVSLQQLGLGFESLQGKWKEKLLLPFKKRARTSLNFATTNNPIKLDKVRIIPVIGPWESLVARLKPDAFLLPTVRFGQGDPAVVFTKLARMAPLFLHEYGNTMKQHSAFDFYKERHNFFSGIFTHGKLYHQQAKDRKMKTDLFLTGGSKTDFYHQQSRFPPPTKKPYIVYCNTTSHQTIYDNRLSEPLKWFSILRRSCRLAGFELIIKLHHHTYFLFQNTELASNIYFNGYTADLFRGASGIIADPSSVLCEALLANKPLFVPKLSLPDWAYIKTMLSACQLLTRDPNKNKGIISKAINNDAGGARRKQLIRMWWHRPNGQASSRIWKRLLSRV